MQYCQLTLNLNKMKTNFVNKLNQNSELQKFGTLSQMRVIDETEQTDDPGNTILIIAFIPFKGEDNHNLCYNAIPEIQKSLSEDFDSSGDHSEDITVLTQNNEFLIIYNANC